MSSVYVMIAFLFVIVLLIILVSKVKLHASISLLIVTMLLGILLGTPLSEIPETINSGFGNTCKSVALVIFLGSLLGKILGETGGAIKITNTLVKIFGKNKVLWAVGIAWFTMGILIFPDTVGLLLIPICSNLAATTGVSMAAFAALDAAGIMAGALVPPAAGPVAAAALLELSLGEIIPWGILVSIPGVIVLVIFSKTIKMDIKPKEEYLHGLVMDESQLPSFLNSVIPILIPIVLIIADTIINTLWPETMLSQIFGFVGSPLAALFIGVLFSIFLNVKEWWKKEEVKNTWITQALTGAVTPLFITALGGSLAAFIKNAGVAEMMAEAVINTHISGIFVPMLIAIMIRIMTGSCTLTLMTAAAIVQPMLSTLGVSNLAAFLAIGAGAVIFSHANSSGFWLISGLCNLDFKQGLRSIGAGTAIGGGTCCITVLILYFIGLI